MYTHPLNNTVYIGIPPVILSMTSTLVSSATVRYIPPYEHDESDRYGYERIYCISEYLSRV
jgi:hypothetical protein